MIDIFKSLFERKNLLAFIFGLLSYFKIRTVGTFVASELIAITFLIPVFQSYNKWKNPRLSTLTILALLWLIGAYISDIYNDSSTQNCLKGFFNITFLISCIPFVAWLVYDSPKRLLYFWLGLGISKLYNYYFQHDSEFLTDEILAAVWGVYAYRYIFLAIGCIAYFIGKRYLAFTILLVYGFYSLFFESRNIFLTSVLAVTLIVFFEQFAGKTRHYSLIKKKLWKLTIVLCLSLFAISSTYEYLASNGTLGKRAQAKYYMQSSNTMGLASGRAGVFESLYFCIKNPIFGYGSYAKDKDNISAEFHRDFHTGEISGGRDEIVPCHSFILGSWVFNGIFGLLFWLWVIYYLIKTIPKLILYDKRYLYMNISFICILMWDILFSPFQDRILILMTLIPLFYFENKYLNKV